MMSQHRAQPRPAPAFESPFLPEVDQEHESLLTEVAPVDVEFGEVALGGVALGEGRLEEQEMFGGLGSVADESIIEELVCDEMGIEVGDWRGDLDREMDGELDSDEVFGETAWSEPEWEANSEAYADGEAYANGEADNGAETYVDTDAGRHEHESGLLLLDELLAFEVGSGSSLGNRVMGMATFAMGPTLRKGDKGPAVAALQRGLTTLGHAVSDDGDFGSRTEAAVRAFQSRAGITVDGAVGPQTKRAILDALARHTATTPTSVPAGPITPTPMPPASPATRPGATSGPAPGAVGMSTVAVTPFAVSELEPLLTAAARNDAVRWTANTHPRTSGISPAQLRQAVSHYIGLAAVERRLSDAGGPGATTADGVLIEAIHQFQRRTYASARQHDGKAGPSTLDSLGLVSRTGLTPVRRPNSAARKRLDRIDRQVRAQTVFSAATWFDGMVDPSFLGQTFTNGIHTVFAERLRLAERHLLGMDAYRGLSPAELGSRLGITEQHKGARPTAATASMHTFGLAVDINYRTNPWISGQPTGTGNQTFISVFRRASLLVEGAPHTLSAAYLHGLSGRRTGDIVNELAARNATLRTYLGLGGDQAELQRLLDRRRAAGTAAEFQQGRTAADWSKIIAGDVRSLTGGASNFSMGRAGSRDPRHRRSAVGGQSGADLGS
jgi:peptidoglycan hydrolase-like protein with peptidoglycan-binding domain